MKIEHKNFLWRQVHDLQLTVISGVTFTQREIDIIACLLSGKTSKKIALFLTIAPKTVENHVRNIMLKLGCRTQENIIDFIEQSNEFGLIKKHYSRLLIQFFFEAALKKISTIINKEPKSCIIICNKNNKECMPFIYSFNTHLNNVGLKTKVTNGPAEGLKELTDATPNYLVYIHSWDIDSQEAEKNEVISLSNAAAIPIIVILYNKNIPGTRLSLNFTRQQNIVLIEEGNYYFLIFTILRKMYATNIESTILEFKKRYESLYDSTNKDLTNYEKDEIPKNNAKILRNKKVLTSLLFVSVLVALTCAYLPHIKVNPLTSTIIKKSYSSCALTEKYLAMLEEEEGKLGNLIGNIETLKFLNLKNDFIKISNRLFMLKAHDKKAADNLLNILRKTFPINQNNRRNEKIHKLFFMLASYYGKLAFLEKLLENAQFSFLDFKDDYGNTAPMLAAAGNQADTFDWLVNKDSLFINHRNVEGNSALILATLNLQPDYDSNKDKSLNSIKMIQKITEKDPGSAKLTGHKECTALLIAGAKGNIATIEYLLNILAPYNKKKQLEILETQTNVDGNNIVLLAAYNGRKHLLKWLHKKGVNLNKKNKYNTSAFMQAASGGNIETMDLLFQLQGSSVLTEKNIFGNTAIFLAAHDNRLNVFQWILEKLKVSYFDNDEQKVADYIKRQRNSDCDTLLHVLISGISGSKNQPTKNLNTGLLDILLRYISVNTQANNVFSKSSDTPLMRAAYYGNLKIIKYLVEQCGADINAVNSNGETAAYFAAMGGQSQFQDVIEYLWEQQAKHAYKTIEEIRLQTSSKLFLAAVKNGQKLVIEWFLKKDPTLIEERDTNGDNVLFLAINNFHIDVLEFLFNWNKIAAARLITEKPNPNSQNILEKLSLEEKSGVNRNIRLISYLEQKVGALTTSAKPSFTHNDASYKLKTLTINIESLSTDFVQPWSPYYLHSIR